MKKIFKALITSISLLSLTACMNLLPTQSPRTRSSKSSKEEISESINRSSNEGNSGERSSNYMSSSALDYFVTSDTYEPTIETNSRVTVRFYLMNSNGYECTLSNNCYITTYSGGLDFEATIRNKYYEVTFIPRMAGDYRYKVTLTASTDSSSTRSEYYYLHAYDSGDDSEIYIVDHPNHIEVAYGSDTPVDFYLMNKYTGALKCFDVSHPFDVDISSAPSIQVEFAEVVSDNTILRIYLKGINFTTVEGEVLYVKVIDENGNTYNTELYYFVKPLGQIRIATDPLIVNYGETATFTAQLYDGMDGTRMNISKEGWDLSAYEGFVVELDYIDNTKIRVNVTNVRNVSQGFFSIRVLAENGFMYEDWFFICTEDYYYNYYWVQIDGGSFVYQKDSYFRVILYNHHGDNKIIQDLIIETRNGIIPSARLEGLNVISYDYHFVPTRRGTEVFSVTAKCPDGTSWSVGCEITIN